jgi:hypothetical protein
MHIVDSYYRVLTQMLDTPKGVRNCYMHMVLHTRIATM